MTNSFGEPERLSPVESKLQVESARFDFRCSPLSLTVMQWPVEPR